MPLTVTPETAKPLPDDFDPEEPRSFAQQVKVAAATAKLLLEAGAEIEPNKDAEKKAEQVFQAYTDPNKKTPPPTGARAVLNHPASVQHLFHMLQDYDHDVVAEAKQLRRYVTNKLLEESGAADNRQRIKALELLGKISDVGLFADKTEVTIKNVTTEDLEDQIKNKLLKLLGQGTVVDATYTMVDDELGDGADIDKISDEA